jgi:hypothetical protein
MQLCVDVYKICQHFPSQEKYALANQMERAFELETQLKIALALQYLSQDEYNNLYEKLGIIQKGIGKFIGILKQERQ